MALASTAYNGPLAGGQPAAQYPAGVDPKACPNFPICGNPAVAVNQVPESTNFAPQYQPQQYQAQAQYQPQYQAQAQYQPQYRAQSQYQPQYQPQAQYTAPVQHYNPAPQQYAQSKTSQYPAQIQDALNRGEYIGDGDYHGEGLDEAQASGYEGRQQAYNAAPAYNHAAQYNPAPAAQYHQPRAAQYNAGAINYHGVNPVPAGVDPSACPNYPFCS